MKLIENNVLVTKQKYKIQIQTFLIYINYMSLSPFSGVLGTLVMPPWWQSLITWVIIEIGDSGTWDNSDKGDRSSFNFGHRFLRPEARCLFWFGVPVPERAVFAHFPPSKPKNNCQKWLFLSEAPQHFHWCTWRGKRDQRHIK